MSENATQKFYDRISHAYDLIADGGERQARETGLRLLSVRLGEEVLEIGYGTGHSLVELARAVGDQGRVSGVDISEGMCRVATKRVREAGLEDRVALTVQAVPPLPYDDACFDVVNLSFTLELFPLETIPTVLAEIRRVLFPFGRVGIVSMATTPPDQPDSLLERTYKWMHQHFPHFVDCQPIDVEASLRAADFRLNEVARLNIFSLPVIAVVASPAD